MEGKTRGECGKVNDSEHERAVQGKKQREADRQIRTHRKMKGREKMGGKLTKR